MATDRQYVLSGVLLAQLIGDAATLSRYFLLLRRVFPRQKM